MSKIIPNTFQSPNAHVDEYMQYLTGDEYKVLAFAVRHIYGWQDRASVRQGRISLSTFSVGYITENGTHYGGTGLSRPAVISIVKRLVDFGLLVKDGEPTNDGQMYSIGETPDAAKIMAEWEKRELANKTRSEKMNAARDKKRQGGSSHDTGIVARTTSGSSHDTGGGSSHDTHIKPSSNPLSKPSGARAKSVQWQSEELALSEKLYTLANLLVKPHEESSLGLIKKNQEDAAVLVTHGVTPDLLERFWKSKYTGNYKPSTLGEISRQIGDFMANHSKAKPATTNIGQFQNENRLLARALDGKH